MPKRPPKPVALPISWQAAMDDHIIALAWSPDGQWLAVAEVSGPITLFDAATGTRRWRIDGHGFGTTALGWRPDGVVLCSAGQDGSVRWSAHSSGRLTISYWRSGPPMAPCACARLTSWMGALAAGVRPAGQRRIDRLTGTGYDCHIR